MMGTVDRASWQNDRTWILDNRVGVNVAADLQIIGSIRKLQFGNGDPGYRIRM